MDRRQLQPVEEAVLVVLGEVLASADHREDTRLDEREGEREGEVGVRREAREGGGRLEPDGVDRQQEQREGRRRDDRSRLANRAHDRAAGELRGLHPDRRPLPADGEGCVYGGCFHHAAAPCREGCSPVSPSSAASRCAPSSDRPVLVRKTSLRLASWSSRLAIRTPPWSNLRMMSASSSLPSSSRTAAPRGVPGTSSPKERSSSAARSRSMGSAGTTSTVGRPTSALSASVVPSATIFP